LGVKAVVMTFKISGELAEACQALWLSGATLSQVSLQHHVPVCNLAQAISRHSGISIKQLKDTRLQNIAERIFNDLLTEAKATGYRPTTRTIDSFCKSNPAISKRVKALFIQAGFHTTAHLPSSQTIAALENRARVIDLYIRGKYGFQIAEELRIGKKRVSIILDKYRQEHPGELQKLRGEEQKKQIREKALAIAEKLGRMPRLRSELEDIPEHLYHKHARGYLREMGYQVIRKKHAAYPRKDKREQLLEGLRNLGKQLGHTPSCKEIKSLLGINSQLYNYWFGSFTKAQQLAGLAPTKTGAPYGNRNGVSKRKFTDEASPRKAAAQNDTIHLS
jgi:hypothetical protein